MPPTDQHRHDKPTPENRDEWPVNAAHGSSRTLDPKDEAAAERFARAAAENLFDDKCTDVLVLDVRGRSQVTDFFVLATGTSSTQMRAAAAHVLDLAKQQDFGVMSDNAREPDAGWILTDLVDVIVHLFDADTRAYYDLEMLWGDAPRIPWAEHRDDIPGDGATERNRAGLTEEEREDHATPAQHEEDRDDD